LLDLLVNQELLGFKDLLDLQVLKAREDLWDCLGTRAHKVLGATEENPAFQGLKEQMVLESLDHQEFPDLLDLLVLKEKTESERREFKVQQDQEDILALEARWVPLALWVLASNVPQL